MPLAAIALGLVAAAAPLEDRARLVRFVASERGHVRLAQAGSDLAVDRVGNPLWEWIRRVLRWARRRRTVRTSRYGLASAAAPSATSPPRAPTPTTRRPIVATTTPIAANSGTIRRSSTIPGTTTPPIHSTP